MDELQKKALIYYYLKMREQMPFLKGLKYRSCFQFIKMIDDLGSEIEKGHVIDFDAITKGAI